MSDGLNVPEAARFSLDLWIQSTIAFHFLGGFAFVFSRCGILHWIPFSEVYLDIAQSRSYLFLST